jgi:hypothetical protein
VCTLNVYTFDPLLPNSPSPSSFSSLPFTFTFPLSPVLHDKREQRGAEKVRTESTHTCIISLRVLYPIYYPLPPPSITPLLSFIPCIPHSLLFLISPSLHLFLPHLPLRPCLPSLFIPSRIPPSPPFPLHPFPSLLLSSPLFSPLIPPSLYSYCSRVTAGPMEYEAQENWKVTTQHSAAQCGASQHSTPRYSTAQFVSSDLI